jgi:hypothetical protein
VPDRNIIVLLSRLHMEEGVSAAGNIEMAIASGTLPDLKHSKMAVKTPFTLSFIVSVPPERKKPFKKNLSMKNGRASVRY